ncbi:EamA family transporter RarD [Shouchella shacheensis]|uniref:EamA family transporter RarD n=1 Tax=Shouchella shacheensis TaxID=1649580 RepID=UPI00073FB6FC|nr:EamA family transporter RarD [Shouchella shacheensis]
MHQDNEQLKGTLAALAAYGLWGLLPLYWGLLDDFSALGVLAYRIVFSFAFILGLFLVKRELRRKLQELKQVVADTKQFIAIALASLFISMNWFIFIFAVSSEKVIDASLGYYINPLLNVVLATLLLKEKLKRAEQFSVLAALIGVLVLIVVGGYVPWASLGMALSFCLYGFLKRGVRVSASGGLLLETVLVTPLALLFIMTSSLPNFFTHDSSIMLLLFGSGIVTAIPLMLFSFGAQRISFALIGFLQYIAPTLMLILGIFVFHEPFSAVQFVAFAFIWLALLVFTGSRLHTSRSRRSLERKKHHSAVS